MIKDYWPIIFRFGTWVGLLVCTNILLFLANYDSLEQVSTYNWTIFWLGIGKELFATAKLYFDQSYSRHKAEMNANPEPPNPLPVQPSPP